MLKEHKDNHNPPPESGNIANAMGISLYVNGQRYNVSFFNKRLATSFIERVQFFTTMCNTFEIFYRQLPPCQFPIVTQSHDSGSLNKDSSLPISRSPERDAQLLTSPYHATLILLVTMLFLLIASCSSSATST